MLQMGHDPAKNNRPALFIRAKATTQQLLSTSCTTGLAAGSANTFFMH